jgi:hypothetical protein
MRSMVFVLITFVIFEVIESVSRLHSDEAWLVAGFVGVAIAYWVKPCRKDNHLKCLTIYLLLVLGMYFFAFKVPPFLSGLGNSHLATILCVAVYASCYWFFVTRKLE